MKKILLLCFVILFCGCAKIAPVEQDPFSTFLGTRANAPLENTIWGHETGEQYNMYLLFQNGLANLFYGLYDADEGLQRWSPFYSAPYRYEDRRLETRIVYKYFGNELETGTFNIIESASEYEIAVDGLLFRFVSTDTSGLNWQHMTIFAGVTPWDDENN